MSVIQFRLAARTDVGLVRTNNEDNFQACDDLAAGRMHWVNNELRTLGDKGALLVVADGMGGMNAGEVASELAISTVRDYFSPEKITESVTKSRFTIERYMNEVIVAADARIKAEAKSRPETRGMGTTIVIAWLLDGKLYISWCGDSRAYVYNPAAGLHQLTKDHSYVQSLVDKGAISHEDAFDFPDSNIITRCLSDATTKAKPESLLRPYAVCDGDIIILCTDGLCGMIRDNEIEAVVRDNEVDMDQLVTELIRAACEAAGADNVTICLCQILSGGAVSDPKVFEDTDRIIRGEKQPIPSIISSIVSSGGHSALDKKKLIIAGGALLAAIVIALALWFLLPSKDGAPKQDDQPTEQPVKPDTIEDESATTETPPPDALATDPTHSEGSTNDEGTDGPLDKLRKLSKPQKTDGEETQSDDLLDADLTPVTDSLNKVEVDKPSSNKTEAKDEEEFYDTYTLQRGDTYDGLSKVYGISVDSLQRLNGNKPLKAGDTIKVPKKKK